MGRYLASLFCFGSRGNRCYSCSTFFHHGIERAFSRRCSRFQVLGYRSKGFWRRMCLLDSIDGAVELAKAQGSCFLEVLGKHGHTSFCRSLHDFKSRLWVLDAFDGLNCFGNCGLRFLCLVLSQICPSLQVVTSPVTGNKTGYVTGPLPDPARPVPKGRGQGQGQGVRLTPPRLRRSASHTSGGTTRLASVARYADFQQPTDVTTSRRR